MSGFDRTLRTKKAIFLDLDGTVYLGDRLIDGSVQFLEYLRQRNITHYYLSNNSSRSKKDYVTKLSGLGIKAGTDQIILSTDGVIEFLKKEITWMSLVPDFLVSLVPLAAGIFYLVYGFNWPRLILVVVMAILAFPATGYVRVSIACGHCKQKEYGCPAVQFFSKDDS